jgi:hypothetical protein
LEDIVEKRSVAQRLRTHPGAGALTALLFVLIIGRAERFGSGKAGSELSGTGTSRRIQRLHDTADDT